MSDKNIEISLGKAQERMPKSSYKLSRLVALLVVHISSVVGIFYAFSFAEIPYILSLWVAVLFLFALLKEQFSFPLLFIAVIGFGFFSFYSLSNYPESNQLLQIAKHLLILIGFVSIWTLIHLIKNMAFDYTKIKEYIDKLRKIDEVSYVLTENEFVYRLEQILANIKRNKFDSCLLLVNISEETEYKKKILVESIGKALINTVRGNYDIVGYIGQKSFLVTLQACKIDEIEIVIQRFLTSLESENKMALDAVNLYYSTLKPDLEFNLPDYIFDADSVPKGVIEYDK